MSTGGVKVFRELIPVVRAIVAAWLLTLAAASRLIASVGGRASRARVADPDQTMRHASHPPRQLVRRLERRPSVLLLVGLLAVSIVTVRAAGEAASTEPASKQAASKEVAPIVAPGARRPEGARGTVIVPDRFLRRWDPVTIFFATDQEAARGGPEDHPERFVTFSPSHPGAFAWLDARTLQFRPAEPWPPLARFSWKASGKTADLVTLMVMPTASLPANGSDNLEPVDAITLTFPEPLDPEDLARMTSIELRPLPGVGGRSSRWLSRNEFDVKALDMTSISGPAVYVLSPAHAIPLGTKVILHFRLALEDAASESFGEIAFATAETFRIVRAGTREVRYPLTVEGTRYTRDQAINGGTGERALIVEFSSPPAPFGPVEGRNLVRFTPAVSNLSYAIRGNELEIGGGFEPETVYQASLVPSPLTDAKGRALTMTGENQLCFYFPARPSFVQWTASEGIAERYGPKMVPVLGRGMDRADLRLYRIDPLDRSYWPFPASPLTVDESQRPPGPGEEPAPFVLADRNATPTEIEAHLRALGAPPVSRILPLPLRREGRSASFGIDLEPHLSFLSGKNRPGTYLVGLRALGGANERSWIRLQVTDLSLTAFEEPRAVRFVVTSIASGDPISGARVRVEGTRRRRGSDPEWTPLADGVTGADGSFRWEAPGFNPDLGAMVNRVVVQNGEDTLVLDPHRAPNVFANNQWSASHRTWLQWTQERLEGRGPRSETLAHIFTERPLYRPEEKVHIKGYVRRREHGELGMAALNKPLLIVTGPGDLVWRYPITLTAAGSFYHHFSEEKVPTGDYSAHLEDAQGTAYGSVSFKIEAYRLPLFEVSLHAPDRTSLDKEFDVGLTATYYAGGRVAARPVQWRVTQFPYDWSPKTREGFLYSSDARFSGGGAFQSTPRIERQDTTDEEGAASIVLDPAIEPTAQPRTYVVEATVTGADDQTVTATARVRALPPFTLGLKVPRYIEHATAIEPQVLVLGSDGEPLSGTRVTVRLLNRQWHSHLRASDFSEGVARYITDVVDEKVSETTVVSGAEPAAVTLPVRKAGVYVVELEAHDRLGRAQVVSADLYAGGEESMAWQKPTTRVFEVATDKDRYDPGDTAVFVLKSPFQKASALAVVEAPSGNEYHWVAVEGGAATFKLSVLKTHAPRLPVHFVLMRGRIPGTGPSTGSGTDLGKPATMASTAWIRVEPEDNRAEVKLRYPEKARPGETIEVEIELSDRNGDPLAGEVTLWLVDQAVLALGKEARLDPLPDFITDVASHLAIRDTRDLVFGLLPFAEQPGGDRGEKKEAAGLLEKATVRRRFKTVPYYNPEIAVGPDGKAKVRIELSDDLTVFKLRAKAACGPDRFGYGTGEILVRLPVIVQPALPRFVRPGDSFTAAAIGRVVEGEGGPGAAEARVEGVTIAGPVKREITWITNRPERIEFPVEVPTPPSNKEGEPAYSQVSFLIGVERASDGARDAFEVKLPIRSDRMPVVGRAMEELRPGSLLTLPAVAGKARPGTVRRSVLVSDQPALVRMAAGLEFLQEYPYGCTEQRLSRSRAELAMKKFRTVLHDEEGEARLDRLVHDTLDWIAASVDANGLVAYWPGGEGRVSLTAWTVMFLTEAREAGVDVDPKLADTLTRSLQKALRSDFGHYIEGESWAERAWALTALAGAGKFDPGYGAELARKAEYLDVESTALVVHAFARGGQGSSPAVPDLTEKLWKGLIIRLYQGRQIYGGMQKAGYERSNLILPSETRALSEVTRALAATKSSDERLKILIEALVTLGRGDGWGDTNANASALLALSEVLSPPFAGSVPRTVTVRFGEEKRELTIGPEAPIGFWKTSNAAPGEAELSKGAASGGAGSAGAVPGASAGTLIVRAETSYVPMEDGSLAEPAAKGFVVTREMLRIEKEGEAPERIALTQPGARQRFTVGDVVEEHVQVVSPRERTYVAVVVPLAAGMEPLNPRLATAPPEAKPAGTLTRPPTYVAFLDDQVAFYYDALPRGTYDFSFRARATVPGSFIQPAASAELMYDLATRGNSAGARIEVRKGEAR